MAPTATETVLTTPELLTAILTPLPQRDLLLSAPLINLTWNRIIRSSPTLQQKLFFAPLPRTRQGGEAWRKNPLLAAKFPLWFNDIRSTGRRFSDETTDPSDYDGYEGPYKEVRFGDVEGMRRMDWVRNPEAYARAGASWRRMLVVQPAVGVVKVVYAENERVRWKRRREVRELGGEGVRMGWLFDLVVEGMDGEEVRRFGVQWNMFEVEEDEAEEYEGIDGDFLSRAALLVGDEERESVTVIFESMYPSENGVLRARSGDRLREVFRSREGKVEACQVGIEQE